MEIKARITMLIGSDYTTIEVEDKLSSRTFLRIKLTPEQLSKALSRLAYTPCEKTEIFNLDKIGKKMIHQEFKFLVKKNYSLGLGSTYKDREELAKKICLKKCPKEWEPDLYFNSQNSFFYINKDLYAKTIIRKWE